MDVVMRTLVVGTILGVNGLCVLSYFWCVLIMVMCNQTKGWDAERWDVVSCFDLYFGCFEIIGVWAFLLN